MNSKFRFLTAGESHGPGLNIIIEGLPSGLEILAEDINKNLKRRQGGYGRGARMKIETDQVKFMGGVRHGLTFGAPVSLEIINKDHQNWLDIMNPAPLSEEEKNNPETKKRLEERYVTKVRPGHADFAGAIKYNQSDVRNILERSSARETTSRVAAGSVAQKLLNTLGIKVYSHVIRIGEMELSQDLTGEITGEDWATIESSEVRCKCPKLTEEIKAHIDEARTKGETLGGIVELIAYNLPIGIGSHVHWDRRLDGILAQALMSVHTAKSVGFGIGAMVGELPGSKVHDQIEIANPSTEISNYSHLSNRAGGIEGGMTNGEPIIARVALKPIPTLARKPEDSLKSIDLEKKANDVAFYERSDVCVVPAGGVVLEAMMCVALADQIMQKFGGDSIEELKANYNNYLKYCQKR